MPAGYVPIFIFAVFAMAFPVVVLWLAKLVRPSAPIVTVVSSEIERKKDLRCRALSWRATSAASP